MSMPPDPDGDVIVYSGTYIVMAYVVMADGDVIVYSGIYMVMVSVVMADGDVMVHSGTSAGPVNVASGTAVVIQSPEYTLRKAITT